MFNVFPRRQCSLSGPTLVLATLLVCATAGCGDQMTPTSPENPSTNQPSFTLTSFISGVTDGNSQGSYSGGSAPQPTGGPSVQVSGNDTVINGGSSQVRLTSSVRMSRVIIFVEDAGGYYSLPLSFASSSVTIILTVAQNIPRRSFTCVYAAVDASGRVGAYVGTQVQVTTVGTGQLQISLTWDTQADVDLHVVEPSGEEIWYGDRTSTTGGQLDLDSNAGCNQGPSSENVTWSGSPPRGTFAIRVTYWSSCGAARTNYVLTITDAGRTPRIYRGTLTGTGTGGGAGSGILVTRYTR